MILRLSPTSMYSIPFSRGHSTAQVKANAKSDPLQLDADRLQLDALHVSCDITRLVYDLGLSRCGGYAARALRKYRSPCTGPYRVGIR